MNSISDRFCIAKSSDTVTAERFFSVQDSLECCPTCTGTLNRPCDGGYLYQAFLSAKTTGSVSGDGPDQPSLCKPYSVLTAATGAIINPKCSSACAATSAVRSYTQDKATIRDFQYGMGVDLMVQALNEGGSIAVSMNVSSDFLIYKTGIYYKRAGSAMGAHAIRIVGYGSEKGVAYWIAANSWGAAWGENGFFRIRKGTNECNIEKGYFFAATI